MKKIIISLLLLPIVFTAIPFHSYAKEDLQAMIDSAKEGDVLKLENKTYVGNITVNKKITIMGDQKTVIKGNGDGNVISIKTPGVTLAHLTVTNSGMNRNSSEEYAAIKVHSNANKIEDIIIKDSFHGIYLSQSHRNTVQNIRVSGLGRGEIANQGNGLHVYYSNKNILKDIEIKGTRDGMFFDYSNDNEIIGNKISDTRYGLHYMYSDQNDFSHNLFTFNTGGAAIMHSNGIKLSNNDFIFNYGHRSFGILLLSSNDTTVAKNTFFLNQRGIYIDQSTNNLIHNNRIVKNQIGIELWASSNQQVFTMNQIQENTIPAVTLGGQGQNSWSQNNKGNDWGQTFPLTDFNRNGIGDYPVTYSSSLHQLIEDQELTYLFLKSPAIAVYEKMNKILQQEKIMFEDSHPLVKEDRGNHQGIRFMFYGLLIVFIIKKGSKRLCITSGKNGKKA